MFSIVHNGKVIATVETRWEATPILIKESLVDGGMVRNGVRGRLVELHNAKGWVLERLACGKAY